MINSREAMTCKRTKTESIVRLFTWVLAGAALALASGTGSAQSGPVVRDYPQKPVRFVVPYPPGGGLDSVARLLAQNLQEVLGQPVVVENRPGAGGTIGVDYVAKAPADGYTLLVGSPVVTISPSVYSKLTYNPLTDLAPIIRLTISPSLLVVNPSLPVLSVEELIALARSKPGKLNFASGGVGTSQHLAGELLKYLAKIDIVHVPYKGSVPAQTDLIAGRCDFMFVEPGMLPMVKAGKLRALAVSTAKRYVKAPELPTVAESGLPGYEATNWYGLLAPAGTPKDVISLLNRGMSEVLKKPDVQEKLFSHGYEPMPGAPEQFAQFMSEDVAKWASVVKASGMKPE